MNKIGSILFGLTLVCLLTFLACKDKASETIESSKSSLLTPVKKAIKALPVSTSIPKKDDIEERRIFQSELGALLEKEDFDKLEEIGNKLQTSKERFAGGDWKLSRFFEAVGGPEKAETASSAECEKYVASMRKWVGKKPNSVFAKVFLGDALIRWGWNARGAGFASTVTEKGWKLFEKRLDEAEEVLKHIKKEDRKNCFLWYGAMDRIARGKGWSKSAYDEIFNEAIKLEPQFWDFYQNKAIFLLPRWHGDPGDWEEFAESTYEKIGGEEGEVLHTVITWQVSRFYSGEDFFKQNKVSWMRIRRGFILWEKHYGASYRYLNAFSLLAGAAADKKTTQILMQRIGEHWEPNFWTEKKYFDGYKEWAGVLRQ